MSDTNYSHPDINPANADNSVTILDDKTPDDFKFYPDDYTETQILRNQPESDLDLIRQPQAFADTTDNRKSAARRHASQHFPIRGKRLHN